MKKHFSIALALAAALLPATAHVNPALASGASLSWVQRSPSTSIFPRRGSMMAYDSDRARVVLFGGTPDCSGCNNEFDTYEWDGNNWNLISTPTDATSRYLGAMTYDATNHNILLFGGEETGQPYAFDTWTYDGTNWTQIGGSGFPPGRYGHVLVYDPATSSVVLFGGMGANGILSDTWTWSGTAWTQLQPANSPPARYGAYAAYDPTVQKVVLFGGTGDAGVLNDTWEWDGSSWTQVAATNPPAARLSGGSSFDSVQQRMVIFGGADANGNLLNDTWTFDAASAAWTRLVQTVQPAPRRDTAMAFDAGHGYSVVFAGQLASGDAQDTWTGIFGLEATLSPSSLNLGQGQVGQGVPASQQFVTVTNTGLATLTIYGFAFGGADPNDFSIATNNCFSSNGPFELAVGATCDYGIYITPTDIGTRTGTFIVEDDAPEGSQSITLTGYGLGAIASLSPISLDFGSIKVTSKSTTKTVTLTNAGNENMNVTSAMVQGSQREDFLITQNPCNNATLTPGSSCNVTLYFKPSIVGAESATLVFTDSAASSPQAVSLTGTGTSK